MEECFNSKRDFFVSSSYKRLDSIKSFIYLYDTLNRSVKSVYDLIDYVHYLGDSEYLLGNDMAIFLGERIKSVEDTNHVYDN